MQLRASASSAFIGPRNPSVLAAITLPTSSRTTMPHPIIFLAGKRAASMLHLRNPAGGGIHLLEEVAGGPFGSRLIQVGHVATVPQLG